MRKLAKGHRRVRLLVENDPPGCGHWHSEIFIQWSVSDSEVRGWWHEDKAPPECFAEEPPPPPLVVDDVVEVIANTSYAWRQTRVVTHVFNTGSVSLNTLVLKPHEVKRIGHLDRTK